MKFKITNSKRKTYAIPRAQPPGHERNYGNLGKLPIELIYYIFDHLSLPEIGQIALTSEAFRGRVTKWLWTTKCQNRTLKNFSPLFSPEFSISWNFASKSSMLQIFLQKQPSLDAFGILCKRLTCLSHTCDRVDFAFTAFEFTLQRHFKNSEETNPILAARSEDWRMAIHLFQFMKMLHSFTRGWERVEFIGILNKIDASFKISDDFNHVIRAENMLLVSLELEMKLRLILRTLTWDVSGEDYSERASWIMTSMEYFVGLYSNPRAQALFFLIVFGVSCDDTNDHYNDAAALSFYQRKLLEDLYNHTDWESFTETVPESFHDGKKMFLTLAQAVCSCMTFDPHWKSEMLIPMLNHMFEVPGKWAKDNVAAFLLFCSESLIVHYLGEMILDGETDQIEKSATLLFEMIVVSRRFDNYITSERGIGKVLERLCVLGDTATRKKFYEKIWDAVTTYLEQNSADNDDFSDSFDILADFGVHIMKKAFEKGLQNDDEEENVTLSDMEIEE